MALQGSAPAMDLFMQRLRGSESKEDMHVECKLARLRDSAHSKAEFWSTVTFSDARHIPQAQKALDRGLLVGVPCSYVVPSIAQSLGVLELLQNQPAPIWTAALAACFAMTGAGWYMGVFAATTNEVLKMRHMWCAAGQDCDRALKELQEQRHSKDPAEVAEAVQMLLWFDHVDFDCAILPAAPHQS